MTASRNETQNQPAELGGDMVVGVDVQVPTKLTAEQRALFEQLDAVLDDPSMGNGRGFFSRIKDAFSA